MSLHMTDLPSCSWQVSSKNTFAGFVSCLKSSNDVKLTFKSQAQHDVISLILFAFASYFRCSRIGRIAFCHNPIPHMFLHRLLPTSVVIRWKVPDISADPRLLPRIGVRVHTSCFHRDDHGELPSARKLLGCLHISP